MQKELHPEYFPAAKVVCACGNKFTVGSTKPEIHVEICSNCHPFYTGEAKVLDAAGRVEKFKARRAIAAQSAARGISQNKRGTTQKEETPKIEKKVKVVKEKRAKTTKKTKKA